VLGGSSRIFEKSLRPAFDACGHQIVAVASRDGDSLDPYLDLLARPDIDAVYNPLPNHLHAEWSHLALDAGKHVLCEKPLTLDPADSASLFDHAEAAGLVMMEAYVWPHHPRAQRLLELVGGGEVGVPQWGSARFSWPMDMASGDHRLDDRGAGALFDVGIYSIAPYMLMARRDPVLVAANAVRNELGVDMSMSGWIDWGTGFGSAFHVSFDAPPVRDMTLTCSDGVVIVPGMHTPGSVEPSELQIHRRDGSVDVLNCAGGDAYAGMVQHFADVVDGSALAVFGREESLRLAAALHDLHIASAPSGR
jgi:predicted dehydrogenase